MRRCQLILSMLILTAALSWGQQLYSNGDPIRVDEVFLNTPLLGVLEVLHDKYGVLIAYDKSDIADLYVHRIIRGLSINEALKDIFDNTGLEYQFINDEEVLVRRQNFDRPDSSLVLDGLVVDPRDNLPLAWATIMDSASRRVAYTDQNGRFKLKLHEPQPSGMLKIRYLGYENAIATWSQKESSLYVPMNTSSYDLEEIVVIEYIPTIETQIKDSGFRQRTSSVRLPMGAGGLKDELKSLKLLPGVAATDDLSSGLSVRGGEESESLYLLDGIEFFKVDHFFGIFSAFDANTIDSTYIYLSDFPVQYGGRTSAVVDMQLRNPAGKDLNGQLGLHTLYSFFNIESKITKNSGILFSTRFTNGNISDSDIYDVLFENSNGVTTRIAERPGSLYEVVPFFRFNDSQLKWQWRPTEKASLSATLFSGRDQSVIDYDLTYRRPVEGLPSDIFESYKDKNVWTNGGVNLSYDHQVSKNWLSNVDISVSQHEQTQNILTKLKYQNRVSSDSLELMNTNRNSIVGGSIKWSNQLTVADDHKITLGTELENHSANVSSSVDDSTLLSLRDTAINLNFFASYLLPITPKFDFRLGFRINSYELTQRSYLSPRVAFAYRPIPNIELGMSVGVYNQFLRTLNYEDRFGRSHELWLLTNKDIRHLQSNHLNFSAAGHWDDLQIKLDLYRKKSSNEIEQVWIINGFDPRTQEPRSRDFRRFYGDGEAIGMSLFAQYDHDWYSGQLGYTLARSELSIPEIDDGSPFPAANDRRHELSLVNQFKFGNWTIGNTWVYGSGYPFVSALLTQNRDIRVLSVEERIDRLEDYFRIDVSMDYRFEIWKQEFHAGVSVFNLLNRSNSDQVQYIYSLPDNSTNPGNAEDYVVGSNIQLLPRTLDISIEWHF